MLDDLPDGFQLADLDEALHHVTRFEYAIDAGAHRGIWASHMARRFGTVWAFEPWHANAVRIEQRGNLQVTHAALGARPGYVSLGAGTDNTGEYHVLPVPGRVWMTTLDLCGVPGCDFLKIDVEGMELDVLRGGARMIADRRPVVMFEDKGHGSRYGHALGAPEAWLAERGYRVALRLPTDTVMVPGDQK
jgi:FkbM family methyltransferase